MSSKPYRLFLFALGLLCAPLWADSDVQSERDAIRAEVRQLKSLLADLEQRLEALEGEQTTEAQPDVRKLENPDPTTTEAPGIERYLPSRGALWGTHFNEFKEFEVVTHGFVDLEYMDAEGDGSRSGVSTFDNHHVNVFLRARMNRSLLAHVEIEYEHSGELVEIDQAYLDWTLNDLATLRLGRFYTPFGIERFVWYSPSNSLVSRPLPMRRIVPGNFYANGIMATGHVGSGSGRLSYEVAVSDGLGDEALQDRRGSRQARDNNSSRALSGRLAYSMWRWFEVGASLHTQRYATEGDLDLTFLGLDLSARWKGWGIRAEFVDAEVDRDPALDELRQEGWYAEVSYGLEWNRELLPALRLVARYDDVDLDKALAGHDDQRLLALGANFSIYQHFRLKLEYQLVDEEGTKLDNDVFLSQAVFDF